MGAGVGNLAFCARMMAADAKWRLQRAFSEKEKSSHIVVSEEDLSELPTSVREFLETFPRNAEEMDLSKLSAGVREFFCPRDAGSENAADYDSLRYACPHCGKRFPVSEDSAEYLVACPGCGKQLDLTELDPL